MSKVKWTILHNFGALRVHYHIRTILIIPHLIFPKSWPLWDGRKSSKVRERVQPNPDVVSGESVD